MSVITSFRSRNDTSCCHPVAFLAEVVDKDGYSASVAGRKNIVSQEM